MTLLSQGERVKYLIIINTTHFLMIFGPSHTVVKYITIKQNVGLGLSTRNHPLERGSTSVSVQS